MYHHCMHYHVTTLVMRLPVNGRMMRLADSDWKNNKVAMMADAISSYQACKDEETHVKLNGPSSYALPGYFGDKTARVKLNVPSSYALPCYFGDKTAREWKNDETKADPDTSTYRAAMFGENGEEEH
jgi:hypothetical protein